MQHEQATPHDNELDIIIDYAVHEPKIVREVIDGITPELWQEWQNNGEIKPRPSTDKPLSFIIGSLLIRDGDLRLFPDNELKEAEFTASLEDLRQRYGSSENPSEQAEIQQAIRKKRLERLRLIIDELGHAGTTLQSRNKS